MRGYKVVVVGNPNMDLRIGEKILADVDADIVLSPSTDEDSAIQYISDADVIVSDGAHLITGKMLEAAKKCKLVIRGGVGVDMIDIETANRRGIHVANVPALYYCLDEISDHVLAMTLALQRKMPFLNKKVKGGAWREVLPDAGPILTSRGQIFGLAAFGNLARAVARKAQAFGFKVIAFDPFVSPYEAQSLGVELVDFDTMLETSDVISIHTPLTKSTRHMFNEETFGKMKTNALLINTARGGVVDQKALYNALKAGKIAGAGLDVLEEEPPRAEEPLFTLDNVLLTPHTASASEEMIPRTHRQLFKEIVTVLKGRPPENWVNQEDMLRKL
jgi:D-3-phosphoglycerate dehydrogenase